MRTIVLVIYYFNSMSQVFVNKWGKSDEKQSNLHDPKCERVIREGAVLLAEGQVEIS